VSEFFDSSSLIAAVVEDEPHHALCRRQLDHALENSTAIAAQHSLAEVFHTITGKKGVPAQQVAEILRHNFVGIKWLPLTEEDYWDCIQSAHRRGVRGGAIFDLLLLRVAERHQAGHIYTLNTRHFIALGPHLQNRIVGPQE
jgi:predicted nucleic acid-binding protein